MSIVPFVEERLNLPVLPNLTCEFSFNTIVLENSAQEEMRVPNHTEYRFACDVGEMILREDEYRQHYTYLKDFFEARKGKYEGFRFKNWADYRVESKQITANLSTDGILVQTAPLTYQIVKRYALDGQATYKTIRKVVPGKWKVFLDGVELTDGVTVNVNTGEVVFESEPVGTLSVECEYDLPCRFDVDAFSPVLIVDDKGNRYYQLNQLRVIEIVDPSVRCYTKEDFEHSQVTFEVPVRPDELFEITTQTKIEDSYINIEKSTSYSEPKQRYSINNAKVRQHQLEYLLAFFMTRRGKLQGFIYRGSTRFDQDSIRFNLLTTELRSGIVAPVLWECGQVGLIESRDLPYSEQQETTSFSFGSPFPPDGDYFYDIVAPVALLDYSPSEVKGYIKQASWDNNVFVGNFQRIGLGSYSGEELIGNGKHFRVKLQQTAGGPCFFTGQILWKAARLGSIFPYCHCVKIIRRDGQVKSFTSHDCDLIIDGLTYKAMGAINPTAVNQKTDATPDNLEIKSFIDDENVTDDDLINGMYDGARVTVAAVDFTNLPDALEDALILCKGRAADIKITDTGYTLEVRSLASLLNKGVSKKTSVRCLKKLGSPECGVDMTNFTHTAEVITLGAKTITISPRFDQFYLAEGEIEFTSGNLQGVKFDIRNQTSDPIYSFLTLYELVPSGVQVGDEVIVRAGCFKLPDPCQSKFNNYANFGGFPSGDRWMPGMDAYMKGGS